VAGEQAVEEEARRGAVAAAHDALGAGEDGERGDRRERRPGRRAGDDERPPLGDDAVEPAVEVPEVEGRVLPALDGQVRRPSGGAVGIARHAHGGELALEERPGARGSAGLLPRADNDPVEHRRHDARRKCKPRARSSRRRRVEAGR
jgi:hypothetical protein